MLLISIALPQPLKHMKGWSETTTLIKATHDGIYMAILTKHKHPISHDPGCELSNILGLTLQFNQKVGSTCHFIKIL